METVRSSKRVVKPNIKYINENFTTQRKSKPENAVKNAANKLVTKKNTSAAKNLNVTSKRDPKKASASINTSVPLAVKVASPKRVVSKKIKYRVDFTNVADSVSISECRNFLLKQMQADGKGRRVSIKERKLQIIVKCEKFLKKEDLRTAVKKYLKSLNVVHLTKVTATSKSAYSVSMK